MRKGWFGYPPRVLSLDIGCKMCLRSSAFVLWHLWFACTVACVVIFDYRMKMLDSCVSITGFLFLLPHGTWHRSSALSLSWLVKYFALILPWELLKEQLVVKTWSQAPRRQHYVMGRSNNSQWFPHFHPDWALGSLPTLGKPFDLPLSQS